MPSNHMEKRNENCNAILRALQFRGPTKRSRLSSSLKIRKTSVTYIISDLIKAGFVTDANPDKAQSPVQISGQKLHALIASVTPQQITFARIMLDGSIDEEFTVDLDNQLGPDTVLEKLTSGFNRLLRQRSFVKPLQVGVAFQGVVNPLTGTVIYSANMGGWHDVPLKDMIEREIGHRVYIENDVRCQAWSAAWSDRLLREYENICYVGILDGLASAIIIHGQMIPGGRFSAGQIGHVTTGTGGRVCKCGKTDCLETYCSVPAIAKDLCAKFPSQSDHLQTAADIADLAEKEPPVRTVLDNAARQLAGVLAGISAAIQPQILLLGSTDTRFTEIMRPMIETHLKSELIGIDARYVQILAADSVSKSTLRGCAGFIFQTTFKEGVL